MKIFTTILLLILSLNLSAQKYIVSPGEYNCLLLNTFTNNAYQMDGLANLLTGLPPIGQISAGAHHELILSITGDSLYALGDNTYGEIGNGQVNSVTEVTVPYLIQTDSTGAAWPATGKHIIQITTGTPQDDTSYGWESGTVLSDGSVWVWGYTKGGMRGSGGVYAGNRTNTRPVQVNFSGVGNPTIVKIVISAVSIAMDNTGKVYTWGSNNFASSLGYCALGQGTTTPVCNSPTQISLPATATDIESGEDGEWNYALLSTHDIYGWGWYPGSLGIGPPDPLGNIQYWFEQLTSYGSGVISPISLDTSLSNIYTGGRYITQIGCNGNGSYAIASDSTLWFWGDVACGGDGNGIEPNYSQYSPAYNWNQGFGDFYNGNLGTGMPSTFGQRKPQQIAAGQKFTYVFASNQLGYYAYAEDRYSGLYAWGRAKGGVVANGILECDAVMGGIASTYPNWHDYPWITPVNPFGGTTYNSTCPYCIANPSGSPCSNCTNPTPSTPTVGITATQYGSNAIIINTTYSGTYHVAYNLVTQTAGTALTLGVQANTTDTITGVSAGSYTFKYRAIDTYWDSTSTTATVVVSTTSPPQIFTRKVGWKSQLINH